VIQPGKGMLKNWVQEFQSQQVSGSAAPNSFHHKQGRIARTVADITEPTLAIRKVYQLGDSCRKIKHVRCRGVVPLDPQIAGDTKHG
jgi:hypothetical protein